MSSRLGSDASDRYQVLEEPYNTPDSYRPTTPEANPQPDLESQYYQNRQPSNKIAASSYVQVKKTPKSSGVKSLLGVLHDIKVLLWILLLAGAMYGH